MQDWIPVTGGKLFTAEQHNQRKFVMMTEIYILRFSTMPNLSPQVQSGSRQRHRDRSDF